MQYFTELNLIYLIREHLTLIQNKKKSDILFNILKKLKNKLNLKLFLSQYSAINTNQFPIL